MSGHVSEVSMGSHVWEVRCGVFSRAEKRKVTKPNPSGVSPFIASSGQWGGLACLASERQPKGKMKLPVGVL